MEKRQGLPSSTNADDLNEYAWEIFLYSNKKRELKRALEWSELSLHLIDSSSYNVGALMDTRANILYKSGHTKAAVKQEEEALNRIVADAEKFAFVRGNIKIQQKTLQEIKNREPTSLDNGAIWNKKSKKRVRCR
jgi:hypothetical protein